MRISALWLSLAAVLGVVSAAEAADIYVSRNTGSNKNPGTKDKPKKLLWKVMNKLEEGDTIHVAEGHYFGKGKSGVMPAMSVSKVKIIGGYKADFSARDPFQYFSVIGAPGDRQGDTREVFQWISQKGIISDVTLDGFCIDRGSACYYYSDGEPGANKRIAGHEDNTAWGYRAMNLKKSGSDPTIELIGKGGNFTVRNMLIVNSPWWGISIKAGGTGTVVVENNLILGSRGRGIEAIAGGGWAKKGFRWIIRNNTVAFGHRLKTTEGRLLSIDPKKGYGSYTIENNVFAFADGGGITTKFKPAAGTVTLSNNLFYFCRRADFCVGGKGLANSAEFDDELECAQANNVHELPKFVAKMSKKWLDRWSIRTQMVVGNFVTEDEVMAARKSLGLGAFEIPGYKESYPSYKKLPDNRNNYSQSRYPRPMKKGELIDWAASVAPLIGADGPRGIRAFGAAPVAGKGPAPTEGAAGSDLKDIYVSRDAGDDKNPGTKDKPKKQLWRVMSKLKEGVTVHVAEGHYFGKGKSGVMPAMSVSKVKIIGGYKADFSARDPFKHLSIIGAPGDRQGDTREVFQWISQKNLISDVTLDGFCIDRGGACYYFSDGEPGANKRIAGHEDNTAWGYRAMNAKKSGSDPAIELIGKGGNFTVRNMLIVNSPWWGISIKAGGTGTVVIENNLILVSRGRGIEAIAGGGWAKKGFRWIIRNNTVAFGHRLGATEGRALSIDPKKGYGSYTIEKNVFAFMDGGGITTKFNPADGTLSMNDNLFYFCRRADFCVGGKGLTNADEFEDELECDNEGNEHGLPKFVAKISKKWLDRWSIRTEMVEGNFVTEDEVMAARKSLGLGAFEIPGYKESYPSYKKLPGGRNNYSQSRYPRPMKKGELIDWSTAVLPVIGADGPRGIQAFKP